MNKIKVLLLTFGFLFMASGCSQKKPNYIPVDEFPKFEEITRKDVVHTPVTFENTSNEGTVTVIHSLENTSFHVYNASAFETQQKGVLVGGTGLRIRSTIDGGLNWREIRLSRFADAFHSAAFSNGKAFVVGEGPYIVKSDSALSKWSVFDISTLEKLKATPDARLYKIKFQDNLGYAMGISYRIGLVKTCILKTRDGGENWEVVSHNGFQEEDTEITDFELLSDNILFCTTVTGQAYKSLDGGTTWENIFEPKKTDYPLNSIAFKNEKIGFVSGPQGVLFSTTDGGDNWEQIDFIQKQKEYNIADIKYLNDGLVAVTTAKSFVDKERPVFSYLLDGNGENEYYPLLTKNDSTLFFEGDSFHLFPLHGKQLFITDRNAIYKLDSETLRLK